MDKIKRECVLPESEPCKTPIDLDPLIVAEKLYGKAEQENFSEELTLPEPTAADIPAASRRSRRKRSMPLPEPIDKHIEESVPESPVNNKIDFSSFVETEQNTVIELDPLDRSIVNAGPGTGKTWTLIEKIIHMLNENTVAAENIMVLCFSRSAVEVIKTRLQAAAEEGRIEDSWKEVEVRTFDSLATYMLVWIRDNYPELLPTAFSLSENGYDDRIKTATDIFRKKDDILAGYEHIIVDEVQDLVGSRAEMVLSMLAGLPNTCGFTLLGDSCQSLYDYLSSNHPEIMSSEKFYQEIFDKFPDANYFSFTKNQRQNDDLKDLTLSYRQEILTGTPDKRSEAAKILLDSVPSLSIKLQHFDQDIAEQYRKSGTLGILTRTNAQALQISSWLRNQEVSHQLKRGLGSTPLGDWIADLFFDYPKETIDEAGFIERHLELFPDYSKEEAMSRWIALTNTQKENNYRYEVEDILKGLLYNAKDPQLYRFSVEEDNMITVSNIHRAKGQEYDSVIVVNDVIEAMTDPDIKDVLEHKVCYVALTRPKKKIERVEMSDRDKQIYITQNEDYTKRCSKASISRGKGKRYISHFEVGNDTDFDMDYFAANEETQGFIQEELYPGDRLRLIKCPEGTNSYITYRIVPEDNERICLGYTTESFGKELEKAIQHILKMTKPVFFEVFPHAFCDIYVENIMTCISEKTPAPPASRSFGNMNIWSGFTITGLAAVDKETY